MTMYIVGVSVNNSLVHPDGWWWLDVPDGGSLPRYVMVPHDITGAPMRGTVLHAVDCRGDSVLVDGAWVIYTDGDGRDHIVKLRGTAQPTKSTCDADTPLKRLKRMRQESRLLEWAREHAPGNPAVAKLLLEVGDVQHL